MNRPLLFALLAGSISLMNCSAPPQEEDSESDLRSGRPEPVHGNSAYFWAPTDYVAFKRAAQAPPFRVGAPLAPDNEMVVRLQAWADLIHAAVVKDVRRKLGEALVAPKPIIVVVPAKNPNAWVSGIMACLSGEADLTELGQAGRPRRTAALALAQFDGMKEQLRLFGAAPPKCVNPEGWNMSDAVAFFNRTGSRCRVTPTTGDAVKVTGVGCAIEGDDAPTTATQLTYYATSPYIHFTTAFLALATEESQLVGTIAHELGHYYRAHAVSDVAMGKYNHWYEQTDPVPMGIPTAAPDSAALEARHRKVAPIPLPRVAGQKLSPRLTDVVVGKLGDLLSAANTGEGSACRGAVAKLGAWRQDFSDVFASYVSAETQRQYLEYETALLECAPNLSVTETGGASALKLADLQQAVALGATPFATPALAAGSLKSILDVLQARAAVADGEEEAFHAELKARVLGKYTAEQEADDFSLAYFSRLGQEPRERLLGNFELIKARVVLEGGPEAFLARNHGMTLAQCEELLRADFLVDGRPAFVPLGTLHDPHHGDCYRQFALSQQLRAHGYRRTGTAPTFTNPWSHVRGLAKEATDAFNDPNHRPSAALKGGDTSPGSLILD